MNPVKRMSHFEFYSEALRRSLSTDLQIRDIDRRQHLHFNSFHSDHTKRSIIYSQTLRLTKSALSKMTFYNTEMKRNRGFRRGAIRKTLLTLK